MARTRDDPEDAAPTLPSARPRAPEAGQHFDRYLLLRALGHGGMGVVFLAHDPRLDRHVALKLLHEHEPEVGADARARLLREARALARLAHPNVVPVFDVGVAHERAFVAMEYVDGCTLSAWLRRRRRSVAEILRVFVDAARGLSAAHVLGIVHRDFKPDNVLIGREGTDERARVVDFGLARAGESTSVSSLGRDAEAPSQPIAIDAQASDDAITRVGIVLGTPAYMAPEQHRGLPLSPATDQYAFCVAMFEALTGVRPFVADTSARLLRLKLRGVPAWPATARRIPAWLRRVVATGLQAEPAARHGSMDALVDALLRGPARARRRPLLGAAAGAAAIAAVLAWPQPPARCDAAARVAPLWSPARAQGLAAHFAATGVAHAPDTWRRTAAALDRYSAAWQRAQQQLCSAMAQADAAAGGDAAELDAHAQCLGQRLHALGEWIDVLETADAELVDRAVVATVALPRPEGCADAPRPGTASDPRLRERVDAIDRALQRAHVLENAGRYTTAVETAEAALRQAAELTDPALQARAEYTMGSALEQVGEIERARDHLREALWRGSAVGDDVLVADAGTELVWIDGLDAPDLERALEWSSHVGAALARRPDVARQARLANALGAMYSGAGQPREAAEQFARALALFEQSALHDAEAQPQAQPTAESPDVATAQMNLGITVAELGRLAEGRELLERAQAMYAEIEGPDHPDVANVMDALGGVALRMGDYDAAREQFVEALRRRERALPPGHVAIARSHNSLGSLHEAAGDDVEAEQAYRRALAIFVATLGEEHPFVGATLANLGSTMCRAGRWAEAQDHAQRGLAQLQRALPPEHPWIAQAQLTLVRTALGRGALDEAARERDAIVASCAPTEIDPALCAVLESTGAAIARGRGEANADARQQRARAGLRALGLQASRDVTELERWLAAPPH